MPLLLTIAAPLPLLTHHTAPLPLGGALGQFLFASSFLVSGADKDSSDEEEEEEQASTVEGIVTFGDYTVDKIAEGLGEPSDVLLTQQEWKDSRFLQAVLEPVAELSKEIQASNTVTANLGLPMLKLLKNQITANELQVKGVMKGSDHNTVEHAKLPEIAKKAREILGEQIQKRFFDKPLSESKLLALKLDPTLDAGLVFDRGSVDGDAHLSRMQATYDAEFAQAAAHHQTTRRAPSPRNSPSKQQSIPAAPSSTHKSLKSGMKSFRATHLTTTASSAEVRR